MAPPKSPELAQKSIATVLCPANGRAHVPNAVLSSLPLVGLTDGKSNRLEKARIQNLRACILNLSPALSKTFSLLLLSVDRFCLPQYILTRASKRKPDILLNTHQKRNTHQKWKTHQNYSWTTNQDGGNSSCYEKFEHVLRGRRS